MKYDETCREVVKKLAPRGYTAINIDYNYKLRGAGRYSVSAKNPEGIRVMIAYTGSYAGLLSETREYLNR